ncbi:unnamed protein product [Hymenolepis diminuta]|uniref:Uncharacterized protein n=1 Tax=Hymenolepis diminuta TaxID=6216 RepID=A0A564YKV7_HYMDI|nr:unnamed protein product [Hymenolepis diminuta]
MSAELSVLITSLTLVDSSQGILGSPAVATLHHLTAGVTLVHSRPTATEAAMGAAKSRSIDIVLVD